MAIFSILTLLTTLNGLSTPSKSTLAEKSDPHCSSAKWTLRTKTTSTITSMAYQTSSWLPEWKTVKQSLLTQNLLSRRTWATLTADLVWFWVWGTEESSQSSWRKQVLKTGQNQDQSHGMRITLFGATQTWESKWTTQSFTRITRLPTVVLRREVTRIRESLTCLNTQTERRNCWITSSMKSSLNNEIFRTFRMIIIIIWWFLGFNVLKIFKLDTF